MIWYDTIRDIIRRYIGRGNFKYIWYILERVYYKSNIKDESMIWFVLLWFVFYLLEELNDFKKIKNKKVK